MNKLFYIIMCAMLAFVANESLAQVSSQKNPAVSTKFNRAVIKGNALNIDMDVRLPYLDVKRDESLQISFALVENTTSKNKQIIRMPAIIINGTNKRHMYERSSAINGEDVAKGGAYVVLKSDKELIQFVPYRRPVAYKSWMKNCQLIMLGESKNYKGQTVSRFTSVIQKKLVITSQ